MTRGSPALGGSVAAQLPSSPVTAWTFTATGPISGEAAVSLNPDRVYVGTAPGVLHCLDAAT
ncbi:MAG TPA: PQQ-binding-like beta-propeller repeat protein, partial [Opitutaceae bacterium]